MTVSCPRTLWEEIARRLRALDRRGWPEDGLCSHFGVSVMPWSARLLAAGDDLRRLDERDAAGVVAWAKRR